MTLLTATIKTHVIERTEAGATVARVIATREANGCAIWYEHRNTTPRLIAWHSFLPTHSAMGVIAAAKVHAQRIAREATTHGADFAALRSFEAC